MAEEIFGEASHSEKLLDSLVPGARVLIASGSSVKTAVVFVHGFDGDPVNTWKDFPGVMDSSTDSDWWKNADVYFYNYHDTTSSIDDSADDLAKFLEAIYPSPSPETQSQLSCDWRREYEHLILVGHSEGAVVLRSCLVELGKKLVHTGDKSSILDARLVLFAPAMFGFVPTRWLGVLAAISGIKQIVDLCVAYLPPATEMRNGTLLKQVQEDTEKLYETFPAISAFTAHVVFGGNESIVVKSRYYQDIKYRAVKGRNHTTICKPSVLYQWPLTFVSGKEN